MKRYATTLFMVALLVCTAGLARAQDAQDVTVRDINAIPAENVDQLNQAGAGLQSGDIPGLIYNDLLDQKVRFTAVVLSNPKSSGLSGLGADGFPSRVHVFVRDTSAVSMGNEGMGIQLVDGNAQTTGLINLAVGDVITVVGTVSPFGTTMQVPPESIEVLGPYQSLGLPDTILDPVTITTAEANMMMNAEGGVQVNWSNLASLRDQYVTVEDATLLVRDISSSRPNWLISTDGGDTILNFYDTSLRYRNDRSDYPGEFNVRSSRDPFVPPPPGAKINLTGFVTYADDPFSRGVPVGALLSINPFEDSDLEVTETPPSARPHKPEAVASSSDDITLTATVTADPSRTIDSVTLTYATSADATEMTVDMTLTEGDTYTATIPAQADGVFVFYTITATDNTGASTTSDAEETRVLDGGINEIADVQQTSGQAGGDSPFTGLTLDMDITATVQTAPGFGASDVGAFSIQDDADLNPWTGVFVADADAVNSLSPGDVIHITSAEVTEVFGVTQLDNLTFTTEGSGDPMPHKVLTTDVLVDPDLSEAYEGLLIRFEGPIITTPDARFGEWGFSSDGSMENQIKADDASEAIASDFASSTFHVWERLEFLQGVAWYSFGEFKLVPVTLDDIGAVTNVATEDETVPGTFALSQNYPNPFNPVTTINYQVGATGHVTLEVFDLLGRSVATLVDTDLTAGAYQARFDAQDLASGLYLYRLTAGSQTITKKMMLLK